MADKIHIIGAGLAGCEAAFQAAKRGVKVVLYESKPEFKSKAHTRSKFCELVCSNSLKSTELSTSSGLLKYELRFLDSLVLRCADKCAVPAGGALAVDRDLFAGAVTDEILNNKNIEVKYGLVEKIPEDGVTIIATGPLTLGALNDEIAQLCGGQLYFFDAAAPIISADSIDYKKTFSASRYDKGGMSDYINCPMDKAEYEQFIDALLAAECVILHDFEKDGIFEGCMPVEIMAKRGRDTLRFGPLRPVGFCDPETGKRPYAVVQLRKENAGGTMYNLVGFQTNLKFGEQKRVFSMIPALKDAEFLRYGVMHRNSFINAPKVLNEYFQVKERQKVFIAGQLSGVEGYVESIAAGLIAAINAVKFLKGETLFLMPKETIIGALERYLSAPNPDFQPMNSNFGILPPIEGRFKDKSARKLKYSERAAAALNQIDPKEYT